MKGMRGMKGNKKGMVSSDEESVTTIFVDARPEGTTPGPTRDSVYVSEFLKGGVNLLNLKTGQSEEPVPSIEGGHGHLQTRHYCCRGWSVSQGYSFPLCL